MKKIILAIFLLQKCLQLKAQLVCDSTANVIIYSNYDGGAININVDVNIPNLKIGVVSYEPVTINVGGPFVNNVVAVQFAGYYTTTNNHCTNTPLQTNINGAPAGTDTIVFLPNSPVQNTNGYNMIVCNYSCDTNTNQGGCNTPDQIVAYFLNVFGGKLRYHFTQYGCWNGTYNVSDGGNCCVGSSPLSNGPVCNFQSSDTVLCEKQCLNFSDLSTNNPTSWLWNFTGASVSTSTLQNPTNICYNTYGNYPVSLIACNNNGCDTLIINNFIHANANPVDSIWQSNDTLFSIAATNYQWFNTNNLTTVLSTNNYFVPTVAGNYFVIITDSNGCEAASAAIGINTAFEELLQNHFVVFPNPANGNINFQTFEGDFIQQVLLYDNAGKLVLQKFYESTNILFGDLNIANLPQGNYEIKIITAKNQYRKVVAVVR